MRHPDRIGKGALAGRGAVEADDDAMLERGVTGLTCLFRREGLGRRGIDDGALAVRGIEEFLTGHGCLGVWILMGGTTGATELCPGIIFPTPYPQGYGGTPPLPRSRDGRGRVPGSMHERVPATQWLLPRTGCLRRVLIAVVRQLIGPLPLQWRATTARFARDLSPCGSPCGGFRDRQVEQALNSGEPPLQGGPSHRPERPTVSVPQPSSGKPAARDSVGDSVSDVVRWAAFSCVLVPVVLVGYGTSLAGAAGDGPRTGGGDGGLPGPAEAVRAVCDGRRDGPSGRETDSRSPTAHQGRYRSAQRGPESLRKHAGRLTGFSSRARWFSANFRLPGTPWPKGSTPPFHLHRKGCQGASHPTGTGHGAEAHFPVRPTSATLRDRMLHAKLSCRQSAEC